jgi:TonB-dependent starch-binding outer membrane protein SusC
MKKLLLLLIIFFTAQVGLFAQNKTISGMVKDKNGDVVIGATVAVNGTNRGAITDINGEYTIQASPGEKLIISFVGSETQEIVVGQESKIDILLLENTNLLEEVVISGYGIETFKKETSGAVSKIDQSTLKIQHLSMYQNYYKVELLV